MNQDLEFIRDKRFPTVDLALRKGIHICEDDVALYSFLLGAREQLVHFYERFGTDLIFDPEGYAYLVAKDGVFRRQRLKDGEMISGMVLALYLTDPRSARNQGTLPLETFIEQLIHLVPSQTLAKHFISGAKNSRMTDSDDQKLKESAERSLRSLSAMGFVNYSREQKITPKKALFRFASRARNLNAQPIEMEKAGLIQMGASEQTEWQHEDIDLHSIEESVQVPQESTPSQVPDEVLH